MISCKHARQLFDRHFDGELSPSLQAELHAHQLACSDCQSALAITEACEDVIRYDRREPLLDDSFTDRVMAARRDQQVIRAKRWFIPQGPWYRVATIALSPLAAAASIAMAVSLILPTYEPLRTRMVASEIEVSDGVSQNVSALTSGKSTSEEDPRIVTTASHHSAVPFMDALLGPLVSRAKTTMEGARSCAAEFELLMEMGLSQPTEKLAAQWRLQEDRDTVGETDRANPSPLESLDPTRLNRSDSSDQAGEPALEAF